MKIIKPYAEIMDAHFGVDVLKKIELVGRTCYKSTDHITKDSAPKFVGNLINAGHEAMVEHGSFCFMISFDQYRSLQELVANLSTHLKVDGEVYKPFLRFTNEEKRTLVSANIRAWREFFTECVHQIHNLPVYFKSFIFDNPILFPEFQRKSLFQNGYFPQAKPMFREDLIGEVELMVHCDVTAKFVIDRGVSHEVVRHRPASFAQESTRYCNYSKNKFGNEITVIQPCFWNPDEDIVKPYPLNKYNFWKKHCIIAEADYFMLLEMGATPEEARDVLPTSTKTELIMTANLGEWKHFFSLRACNFTGKAHPQMLEVGQPLLDSFKDEFKADGIFADMSY